MEEKPVTPCIWSESRRPRTQATVAEGGARETTGQGVTGDSSNFSAVTHRSVFQQDYDRLLFSTPVRRLADKTQVWPMEENDGVRTRLTHSHEVSNLARSIGARAYKGARDAFRNNGCGDDSLAEMINPLLLSIGLGHDLGNPPFGHQGEVAIGHWFEQRKDWIFTKFKKDGDLLDASVPEEYWPEFIEFDGNPQSLRLLTRLQTHIDGLGLDLSAATLAAGLKYPVSYSNRNKDDPIKKKGGYFESEKDLVCWIRQQTGLEEGQRHPLTWIMEACDDIAYSVLDVDDVLKKGIMSPDDVLVILRGKFKTDGVIGKILEKFKDIESRMFLPEIQRDIKIEYLRAYLIENLIEHASRTFVENVPAIFGFKSIKPLMDDSRLCDELKNIAQQNAFNHSSVLRMEALGSQAIDGLMTVLWEAISNRKKFDEIRSKRMGGRAKYVFSLISPNYIEQAEKCVSSSAVASILRYRELRLLTDMVSGMTDTFAMRLWKDIEVMPDVSCA
ncbi:deoxyguanosinetriphosphate triphosphohydrolase family protein [Pseudomonas mosselii]|uniref:deoxyguanosinetriphosphate triphosphohydrolase family protein n=1 Tax=Pseudomonas mosselii TaxID=78327 RepID=UPI0021D7F300|nr:dNTP triphosphohydrolase [Pseudomonas mosselii]MCU9529980.1 dNTP triphosphohydrolase [Pseudomonas mosselii]MCU9536548.1 dNTP triphosphohydrolase [Pseudomonas mosselii]MCU9542993.1 dNTP triphosphohydrolase [Pseudomonas mosselii]MCU9548924.1 dNTP triphosphohydrolase [Pseudomonas mosselii]